VLVICTMTYLRHPDFADRARATKEEVAKIGVTDAPPAYRTEEIGGQKWFEDKTTVPQLQRQQITSVGLRHLLPVGLSGLFLLIMVLGLFAGDGNHLHSWSSIFIQDIVIPLRGGKPLSPQSHLTLLRLSVVGCATFAFLFSALVPLKVPIWMWWAITGAIYNAGAGAVIIGGLYWRRATAAGAWTAMALGSTLAVGAILLDYFWKDMVKALGASGSGDSYVGPVILGIELPQRMWLNPQWHGFIVMCIAASTFYIVSRLTCREPFDMDWLLHRGKWRVAADHTGEAEAEHVPLLDRLIGVDKLFTRRDRWVASIIFWWSMFCVILNGALVLWHYGVGQIWPAVQMENRAWAWFWLIYGLVIPFLFAAFTLVWFGIGGAIDLKDFFRTLGTMKRDAHDDGSVRRPIPVAAAGDAEEATIKTRR